jgi:predicted nucleic acid-binding protein
MGYLIDTNVLSELQKGKRTDPSVRDWYAAIRIEEVYLSVLVIGEVRQGIERLRQGFSVCYQRLVIHPAGDLDTGPAVLYFLANLAPWREQLPDLG